MEPVDRRRVRRTLEVAADRRRLWELVQDPVGLGSWLGAEVDLPSPIRIGDRGSFAFPDGRVRRAYIEAVDPDRRLAWRWMDPDDGRWSHVTLQLDEPATGRARLTVTEESEEALGRSAVRFGFAVPDGDGDDFGGAR